ncbi:MAG TPA: DUF2007 domain-containing protein [Longimicrobiales bacterium]
MDDTARWTEVAAFAAVYEAEMAAEMLKQAGIPAITRAESSGIFGPGYAGTVTGGARVLVPADRAEEARELLESATEAEGT